MVAKRGEKNPRKRARLARAAVLARYAAMTPEQRREATAAARAAYLKTLIDIVRARHGDDLSGVELDAYVRDLHRERMADLTRRRLAKRKASPDE